jgi:hypothetical protein
MATLPFTYSFKLKECFVKIIPEHFQLAMCLFRMAVIMCNLECVIKEPPVPTKQGIFSLNKVKSCKVFLRKLLAYIRSYIKSVLRYKFLILNTITRTLCVYVSKSVRFRGYL